MREVESNVESRGRRLGRRNFLCAAATGLLGVIALVACGGSAPTPAPSAAPGSTSSASATRAAAAPPGGKLTMAFGSPAETMNPHNHYHTVTESILRTIYEPLVVRSQDMKSLQPGLATEWKTVNDTTWEFKLRQGVKFHDGTEFNAEAVKWNFENLLDPPKGTSPNAASLKPTFGTIDHVEVVDPLTVRFITKQPDPYLDARISGFGGNLMSPTWFKDKGFEFTATKGAVGTGPYKFVSWVRDQALELEANPDYWGGPPKIQKVAIRPVPETATRVAALKAGEVQLIDNVEPQDVDDINATGKATVLHVPSIRIMFVQLDTRKGPTAKKEVRQALNYAVDVDAIVKNVLGGYSKRVAGFLSPEFFGFDPDLKPYPYDPAKAKALLAQAGYPNGLEGEFDTDNGRYLKGKEVGLAIAGYYEKVGIKAKVIHNEWGAYNNRQVAYEPPFGELGSLWGWGNYTLDADNSFYPRLHTYDGKLQMLLNYSNKEADRLMEEARSTLDKAKRLNLYKQLQALLKDDAPYIFLYQLENVYGVANNVDFKPRADEFVWPQLMAWK